MTTIKEDVHLLRGDIKEMRGDLQCLTEALMGDPEHPEYIGVMERLRSIERFVGGINRLKWLLIGTLIASIATLALRFWPGA